ncbi:MAG: retropepsin-like aspartic protease [Cyanobium sp.]
MPLLTTLVAALIQLQGSPLSGGRISGSASIRLERARGGDTPVLTLASPGGVVRLLIDSGASSTMVTPALARRLGLPSRALASGEIELAGGGSGCGALHPRRTRLPTLELAGGEQQGQLRLSGIEALLLPVAALPDDVDGVLGAPSLRQLPLWIDPQHNRLALGAAALQAARLDDARAPTRPRPMVTIPLRWQRGVPLLELESPGGAVPALADTGAEGLFIRPQLAARLRPLGPGRPLRLVGFCGVQTAELRRYVGLSLAGAGRPAGPSAAVEAIRIDNPIFQQLGVEAIVGQELLRVHPQLWRLDSQPPQLELR